MRTFFITQTGHAYVEKMRPTQRILEMRDGYHPIMTESIFRDVDRKEEPMMFIWQGISAPEGSISTEEFERELFREAEFMKRSNQIPSVSKIWQRKLARIFSSFMKNGILILILLFIGVTLLDTFIGG